MKMTDELTRESLTANIDGKFLMHLANAEPLELKLLSVSELPSAPGQDQFSAIFQAPADAPLVQNIYKLENKRFGEFGIFLVPIGRDQNGVQYEAIFNRLNR